MKSAFNINDFFGSVPDAVRAGVSVDAIAQILAGRLRDGEPEDKHENGCCGMSGVQTEEG